MISAKLESWFLDSLDLVPTEAVLLNQNENIYHGWLGEN